MGSDDPSARITLVLQDTGGHGEYPRALNALVILEVTEWSWHHWESDGLLAPADPEFFVAF